MIPDDSDAPRPGSEIGGRFRIDAEIGRGGMGMVYRATDRVLERPVAIKVLDAHNASDEEFVARFFNEAKIVARLSNNPYVVTIYDLGRDERGRPYLVMELLPGDSVRAMLRRWSRPGRSYVVELGTHVAAALHDAHLRGVIHRDLKPANIFEMQAPGLPSLFKVLDFGLARAASRPLSPEHATRVGHFFGTPRYISPELFTGVPLTPAADVYALGLVLYEVATGRFPYGEMRSAVDYVQAHLDAEPDGFPEVEEVESWGWQRFGEDFADLVLAMLRKKPEDRPSSHEVLRRLTTMQERMLTEPKPAPPPA